MSASRTLKSLLLATALLASAGSASAADTFVLDPTHTAITWDISHFGFSHPSGKFMSVDGAVVLDEKNPQNSSVNVTIALAEMNTGVTKLDEHLKSKDFFDLEHFPTAKYVSSKVNVTSPNTATVDGELTLHGVTKPVTLSVKLNKLAENFFKKQTAGFTATTTLKRSDFGMNTYLPGLGDEITIAIESEANIKTDEAAKAAIAK